PSSSLLSRVAGPSTGKAGLVETDKERISRLVYEVSKGSAFFENEVKKDQAAKAKIDEMRKQHERYKLQDSSLAEREIDSYWKELEMTRDLSRTIVHVDMDAFFASVEELLNPSLKDVPMAVGSMAMISTANYHARKFGVRSAMPGYIAKKLCPQLVFAQEHHTQYRDYANKVREVFKLFDPYFISIGLDEAYLDLTDYLEEEEHVNISPDEAVERLRAMIQRQERASAGIASVTWIAKVCSDINKPNGQYRLLPEKEKIIEFCRNLPIRKANGIGRVMEQTLLSIGVTTFGDVAIHRAALRHLLSKKTFNYLSLLYLGLGSTAVSR
ncbi:hypothetical protein BJ684DRAFT_7950, partial [Piptocephalis cylindrospora]